MKRLNLLTLIAALTVCPTFMSCGEWVLPEWPVEEDNTPQLKSASEYFDFNTTESCEIRLDYGTMGKQALVEVYAADQVAATDDGGLTFVGEPFFKTFLDDGGRYVGRIVVPTRSDEIYVHTTQWGVPELLSARIDGGVVELRPGGSAIVQAPARRSPEVQRVKARDAQSQAAASAYRIWPVTYINNLYAITNWDGERFGRIVDDNGLLSNGTLAADDIYTIQKFLWHGNTQKVSFLDNRQYEADTKSVNTVIATGYRNADGDSVAVTGAEVWLTFASEGGRYQNAIGYYYYPSDQVPGGPSDVKRYVAFANPSVPGAAPFYMMKDADGNETEGWYLGYWNWKYSDAPGKPNMRLQLLYVDEETGEVSTTFPPGYTIGYFIETKYSNRNSNDDETYKLGNIFYYSNQEWNSNGSHFISLAYQDKVVYGVEDGVDGSYEDILFTIDATPQGAIVNDHRPEIIPTEREEVSTETVYMTYAYEDVWPDGGDYDLNDVVVEHKREVTFTNYNYVTRVVDSFTPVQSAAAAAYDNAFAVQIHPRQRSDMSLPDGAVDETETNSIILFPSAKTVSGRTFTIVRSFGDKAMTKASLVTDLNPYIIAQYDRSSRSRVEVHLPKSECTSLADAAQLGKGADAYYVDKDGKHPFAIAIPIRATRTSSGEPVYRLTQEGVAIDDEYPRFATWVTSNGGSDANWYLYYYK